MRALGSVEAKYIAENSCKHDDRLMNVRSVLKPKKEAKPKPIAERTEMGTGAALRKRIEEQVVIRDDDTELFIVATMKGESPATKARYGKQ